MYDLLVQKRRLPATSGGDSTNAEQVEITTLAAAQASNVSEADTALGVVPGADSDDDDECAVKILTETIPETYIRLGGKHGLPGKAWRVLLRAMEPVVFPGLQSALWCKRASARSSWKRRLDAQSS